MLLPATFFPFALRTGAAFLTLFADFGELVFLFDRTTADFFFAAGFRAFATFFGALFLAGRFSDAFLVERDIKVKNEESEVR